jgi:hypothetical protein
MCGLGSSGSGLGYSDIEPSGSVKGRFSLTR